MTVANLAQSEKYQLLNAIWPRMPLGDFDTYGKLYDKYFLYLDEQTSLTQRKFSLYSEHTTAGLLSIIAHLRGEDRAKIAIVTDITEQALRSADIAARMWLTIHIQHPSSDSSISHQWPNDQSLPSLLKGWFTPTSPDVVSSNTDQIPESFSVPNLVRYYGFKVTWTSDLFRHLEIDWKYKQITIFEHVICLRNHLEYSDGCPLPEEIVQEAIDSIKLLFPDNKETRLFLSQEDRQFLKIPFARDRALSLNSYNLWRPNISLLLDRWKQGPKGWSQVRLRPDRSNFLEHSTFWIASVVLLLTIISIVIGAASIVLAQRALDVSIRSLEVSVRSYDLALAIACAEANASDILPHFCE